jgi:hypothetical protein
MSDYLKSPVFSSPAYWVALGVGVVGIGAAAWQERKGSRSRETMYYIDDRRDSLKELRQLRYRIDRWNPRYKGQGHPHDVVAGGTLEEIEADDAMLPGAAAAVADYRARSARGSAARYDESRNAPGLYPISSLRPGAYFKRKADAKKVYRKGDYDRSERTYAGLDTDDISRSIALKGDTRVYVGFDY